MLDPVKTGKIMRYISASLHSSGYLGNGFASTLSSDAFRGSDTSVGPAGDMTVRGLVASSIKKTCQLPTIGKYARRWLAEKEEEKLDECGLAGNDKLTVFKLQDYYSYYQQKLGDGARYVFSSGWFDEEHKPENVYEQYDSKWFYSLPSRLAMNFVQPGGGSWAGKRKYIYPELNAEHTFAFEHIEGIDFSSVSPSIEPDTHIGFAEHAGYVCSVTGLRFVVLRDQLHPDEIVLAFACAFTSNRQWHYGSLRNLLFNGVQIGSVATTLVRCVPPMFRQADEVAGIVQDRLGDLGATSLVLSGYCLGGTIAQYVAGRRRVQAYCINPFPLGTALQRKLDTVLGDMDKYVLNVSIESDWASNFPGIDSVINLVDWLNLIDRPRILGARTYVPAFKDALSCYRRHLLVRGSVIEWAGWRLPEALLEK